MMLPIQDADLNQVNENCHISNNKKEQTVQYYKSIANYLIRHCSAFRPGIADAIVRQFFSPCLVTILVRISSSYRKIQFLFLSEHEQTQVDMVN